MKIATGKELGLTVIDCIEMMEGRVSQYKDAGKKIYEKGLYTRGRSHCRPREGHVAYMDAYYLDAEDRSVENLCYNTSPRRTLVLIRALKSGEINNVNANIINNYATNGHNTRSGLFRSNGKLDRIKEIARSHADYMGSESGSSALDHQCRVKMRNK